MPQIDLMPAATTVGLLVQGFPDDRLGDPTPCPDYTVGDLVEHIGGLALAFTAAAQKDLGAYTNSAPQPDAARLAPDWRTRIPAALTALAAAWREPEAWTGMTRAGADALPGEVGGLVALDEIVLHGWDLAVATGQPYDCDDATAGACMAFVGGFDEGGTPGLFGPSVP